MKIFKILILLNFCLLLFSCNTVKKGFTNQKKSSTDEFLVEKKSPLVQPPDYNELPIPKSSEDQSYNTDNVKNLIISENNENPKNENNSSSDRELEEIILEKIKNN